MARHARLLAQRDQRGVASTATSPEPRARAVSAVAHEELRLATRPVLTARPDDATTSVPVAAGNPRRDAAPPERATGSVTAVIDHDVLERVLAAAMRTGGEFAEVFAEDKRSTSAGLDDGRVEEVTSRPRPRRRHPGRRRRDHRLRPHRRPLRGRPAAPRPRRPRPRPPAAAAAAPHVVALTAPAAPPGQRRRASTRTTVPRPRKVELLHAGRRGRPGQPAAAIMQVSAGYGDSRRRILVANTDGLLADDDQVRDAVRASACVATGDTGMQTGCESHRPHRSASSCSTATTSRSSPATPPRQALTKLRRPPGAERARCRSSSGTGGGGVLFHEACGHGLEADLVGKGASVFTRQASASRSPRRSSRSSTTARWPASGAPSPSTTRATPRQRNVLIEDGVLTDYMWDFLRARKEGRARAATAGARATSTCRWCA